MTRSALSQGGGADDPSHPNMYRMSFSMIATFGTATLQRPPGAPEHPNSYTQTYDVSDRGL